MDQESIRVGLIGLGMIGQVHAKAYHDLNSSHDSTCPRINLVILVPPDFPIDETRDAEIGSPRIIRSSEDFFAEDLDLVDICTPNNSHAHYAELACLKGTHVYCEKPLGRDLTDAEKMVAAAEKANVLTQVAFVFRYLPAYRQLFDVVSSGEIGKPLHFRMVALHGGYLDHKRPASWRLNKDQSGGGVLVDLGIHLIDLLRAALGEVDWIECETKTFIGERPAEDDNSQTVSVDVEDWASCTLKTVSGAYGTLETSRVAAGRNQNTLLEIYGEYGSVALDFNSPNHASLFLPEVGEWKPIEGEKWNQGLPVSSRLFNQAKTFMDTFHAAHLASIEDLLICIQQNRLAAVDFPNGLMDQKILESAYRSSKADGRRVAINTVESESS